MICVRCGYECRPKKGYSEGRTRVFLCYYNERCAVRSMESTILLYKGVRGKAQVQVIFDTNTFWLSQQRMAELFGVTVPTINYHLGQIEQSGEIHLSDAIRKILIPSDKCSGEVMMYNLDVVIAVGYRVVTKQTTAEIIYDRDDAERPHMGLTTWKNAPDVRVIKSDVTIAKNYLSEKEVESLNLLSNAFIDMAELRARDHILMTMADWRDVLSRYIELNNKALLPDAGRITHEQAEEKALTEYGKFRVIQDKEIMSDFDRQLKSLFDGNNSNVSPR